MSYSNQAAIRTAANYCNYRLPMYKSGIVNPLDALESGEANCAIRAFLIGTVLQGEVPDVGFFINGSHGEETRRDGLRLGHAETICGSTAVNTTREAECIIEPAKFDKSPYVGGLVIYGNPALGLLEYARMHPNLPEVPLQAIEEAQAIILSECNT